MNLARLRLILWLLIAALLVAASVWYGWRAFQQDPQGPHFGGTFSLLTTEGRTFTDADLKGEASLMFFGYTYCPDVCPTTLAETVGWREALGLGPEGLRIIFVTVDPDRDTAELLAQYLSSFGQIVGLRGDQAATDRIKADYGVFSEKTGDTSSDSYLVNHTASVYMIGADGRFAGTIAYGEDRDTALAKLRRLTGT